MKPHLEKIKCALPTSRLQSQTSPLLLMGLKEIFRTMETKDAAFSSPSVFLSLLFCMWGHIQWRWKGIGHSPDCQSWSLLTLSKHRISTLSSQQPRKIIRSLNWSNLKCRITWIRRQAVNCWVSESFHALPQSEMKPRASLRILVHDRETSKAASAEQAHLLAGEYSRFMVSVCFEGGLFGGNWRLGQWSSLSPRPLSRSFPGLDTEKRPLGLLPLEQSGCATFPCHGFALL